MSNNKKNSSQKKWFIGIGIALIIIGGAAAYLFLKADKIVHNEIEKKLASLNNDSLIFEYDQLEVDATSGSGSISNVHITPRGTNRSYDLTIDKITLNNLDKTRYLKSKELIVSSIAIENPRIRLFITDSSTKSSAHGLTDLPLFKLSDLQITNGFLSIEEPYKDSTFTLLAANFKITGNDLSTDSTKERNLSILNADTFLAHLTDIKVNSKKGLHQVAIQTASINAVEGNILINSISVTSPFKKYKLGHHVGHEIDWLNISIPKTELSGINVKLLVESGVIHAHLLSINNLDALAFRDKRLKFPDIEDRGLVHHWIAKIKTPFTLDTLKLKNAKVTYQEHIENANSAGKVYFNEIYATATNISNVSEDQKRSDGIIHMSALGKVMGQGQVNADLTFPMTKNAGKYTIEASLSPMNIAAVNPMLEHVGFVKIKSGNCRKLTMNFSYDNYDAKGSMKFFYDDLKIQLLENESDGKRDIEEKIKTLAANTFIVKKENEAGKNFRIGTISFVRDKKKSIINFWWKSVLSGLQSSLGVPPTKS